MTGTLATAIRRTATANVPIAAPVVFCLIAALLILRFGADPVVLGLEAGWSDALAWAFLHHLQWGRDIVYTYGPLGFLQPWSRYVSGIFPWYIAGQVTLTAAFALASGLLIARGSCWTFILFVVAFLFAMTWLPGDVGWALALMFGTAYLCDACTTEGIGWPVALALLAPLLAVVALTKFSVFSLWLLSTIALALTCLIESGTRRAVTALAAFFAALAFVWLAIGQNLGNLPAFVAMGLEVASGYKHAMGEPALPRFEFYGFSILTLFLASCVLMAWRARAAALVRIAVAAAAAVLFWLAFFTRGDHAPWFFPAMSLLPFTLLCSRRLATSRWATIGLVLVVVAGMLVEITSNAWPAIPAYLAGLGTPLRNLSQLTDLLRGREANWQALARAPVLPQIVQRVGSARVDLLTEEQGIVVFAGMNYAPRPVFQSHVTNTPKLQRVNEDYFLGPQAPEFVILRIEAIDQRVPLGSDALALAALLRRYHPVLQEKAFLLLQREHARDGLAPIAPPSQWSNAAFGNEVPVAPSPVPQMFFARIELSWLGRLYTTLFREPPLWITFRTTEGEQRRYRLIRKTAASGFLLNPLVRSGDDWVKLYTGMPLPFAAGVRVDTDSPAERWLFDESFVVTLQPLPVERATASAPFPPALANDGYPGFNVSVLSTRDLQVISEGNRPAAFLHAPATLSFHPAPGHYALNGVFGIVDGALQDPGCAKSNPDGIGASLVLVHADGETLLWHADIDPFRSAGQRGPQGLYVERIDVAAGDVVEYRVTSGPPGSNVNCDWSYVRDFRFEARDGANPSAGSGAGTAVPGVSGGLQHDGPAGAGRAR